MSFCLWVLKDEVFFFLIFIFICCIVFVWRGKYNFRVFVEVVLGIYCGRG